MGKSGGYLKLKQKKKDIGTISNGDYGECCPIDQSIYTKNRLLRLTFGTKRLTHSTVGKPLAILARYKLDENNKAAFTKHSFTWNYAETQKITKEAGAYRLDRSKLERMFTCYEIWQNFLVGAHFGSAAIEYLSIQNRSNVLLPKAFSVKVSRNKELTCFETIQQESRMASIKRRDQHEGGFRKLLSEFVHTSHNNKSHIELVDENEAIYCECETIDGVPSGEPSAKKLSSWRKGYYCFNCRYTYLYRGITKEPLPCESRLLELNTYLSSIMPLNGIDNKKAFFVNAPTGSGKTRWILDQIRNFEAILIVVPIVALVDFYLSLLPDIFEDYRKIDLENVTSDTHKHIIICAPSIAKMEFKNMNGYTVVLDECAQTLKMCTGEMLKKDKKEYKVINWWKAFTNMRSTRSKSSFLSTCWGRVRWKSSLDAWKFPKIW
eukprot:GHVR01113397.1.p1 GENE.GHVR01113397.1~~GHVR01113397.1.p1  ORF type:complete len:435 (-),score=12.10 GHVR01113397.1:803-2107(-)